MEEKRQTLLRLLQQSKDVYTQKELEKLASKEGGIAAATTKDVIAALTSDELIQQAKIGTMLFYWSFPSQAENQLVKQLKDLEKEKAELTEKSIKLKNALFELNSSVDESEEVIKELQGQLANMKKLEEKLDKALGSLQECNPDLQAKYEDDLDHAKDAVARWTSNVVNIRSYILEKGCVEEREFNKSFGIKDNFEDYDEILGD